MHEALENFVAMAMKQRILYILHRHFLAVHLGKLCMYDTKRRDNYWLNNAHDVYHRITL